MDILRGYRFSCLEFKIRSLIFGLLAFANIIHSIGAEDRRPNIVLILCDDHRYDAMSFLGHSLAVTPHMDAMAENGAHLKALTDQQKVMNGGIIELKTLVAQLKD